MAHAFQALANPIKPETIRLFDLPDLGTDIPRNFPIVFLFYVYFFLSCSAFCISPFLVMVMVMVKDLPFSPLSLIPQTVGTM
jgi:hypothetical protein